MATTPTRMDTSVVSTTYKNRNINVLLFGGCYLGLPDRVNKTYFKDTSGNLDSSQFHILF